MNKPCFASMDKALGQGQRSHREYWIQNENEYIHFQCENERVPIQIIWIVTSVNQTKWFVCPMELSANVEKFPAGKNTRHYGLRSRPDATKHKQRHKRLLALFACAVWDFASSGKHLPQHGCKWTEAIFRLLRNCALCTQRAGRIRRWVLAAECFLFSDSFEKDLVLGDRRLAEKTYPYLLFRIICEKFILTRVEDNVILDTKIETTPFYSILVVIPPLNFHHPPSEHA